MSFYISILVSSGYLLLSLISIIQLFRILLYGHKLLSFAFYFLILCLIWSIFRCIYFAFGYDYMIHMNDRDAYLLFYATTILQFTIFSFILVYYEKHMKKQENWRLTKYYIICLYIISIVFLATINIINIFVYCWNGSCGKYNHLVQKIHYISSGVFYLFLIVFYCVYIQKLWKYHHLYYYSPHTPINNQSQFKSFPKISSNVTINSKKIRPSKIITHHDHHNNINNNEETQDIVTPLCLPKNGNDHRTQIKRTLSEGQYHNNKTRAYLSKQKSADYLNQTYISSKDIKGGETPKSLPHHSLSNLSSFRKLSKPWGSNNINNKRIDNENVTLHGKSKAFFSSKFVITFLFILVTRCLWYFILAVGFWTDSLSEQNSNVEIGGLFCIIVWEWIPTIIILIFFRKIPSTDLCCPIFGSCCSYFSINNDDNYHNEDSEYSYEHDRYCCCYCCCCGCSNRDIKRRASKYRRNTKENDENSINITPQNRYRGINDKGNTNTIYTIGSGKYGNYNYNYNRNMSQSIQSMSDTSHSLPDISYYKSPPAPVIQKLIYQQQVAQSWNSQCIVNQSPINMNNNSLKTCDIVTTPSIKDDEDTIDHNMNQEDSVNITTIHRNSV